MKKSTPRRRFFVCIDNEGYEASLELGKLYRSIPDVKAASGEDYGYSAARFFPIEVPRAVEKALLRAAS